MSEMTYAIVFLLKVVIVGFSSYLYSIGGSSYEKLRKLGFIPECLCRHPKAIRRFIAPFVLLLAIVGWSVVVDRFSWWYLLFYPALMGAWSMGYGADKLWVKIVKRAYCGAATVAAGLFVLLGGMVEPRWTLFALQVIMGVSASVLLGAFNEAEEASTEQGLIALLGTMMVQFYV